MSDENTLASRRRFLAGSTLGAAALTLAAATESEAQTQPRKLPEKGKFPIKVISSGNGLEATKKAYEMIIAGADPLDACVAGVAIVEDDPKDNSVGYGGLPNEDSIVELDAAVMHGPTHQYGSVSALRNIKNPAQVAKLVLWQTDHVMLVGEGALAFARAQGFPEENLLTEESRKIWLYWRQTRGPDDDWLPPPDSELDPAVRSFFGRPTGTIHCAGMNANGDISCVTSTSGLAFKLSGRVGDSPIIGAGLYVDNEIGSCGRTGRGEANLQNLSSMAAVELMRGGMSPKDAGLEVLSRVAKHTVPRLLDKDGRPSFDLQFYLIGKDGSHAGVAMWGPRKFAITDAQGTRLGDSVSLFEKG